MELLVVILLVAAAAGYVGRSLYRQFTGKESCASGCSCSPQTKQMCESNHHSPDHFTFK